MKACRFKRGGRRRCRRAYADVHHTQSLATTNVPARDGHAIALPFLDAMTPALAQARSAESAGADGVRLCAERHGHAALEPELRRQARRAAADAAAARAAQGRHPAAGQSDPQHRTRAARRRRRSRPLLRVVPDRRAGEEDASAISRRASRATSWSPTRSASQTRFASLEVGLEDAPPGGRLRLRLFVRVHEQSRVAQRDAAAAADSRSARAVRAAVRRRRGVHARSARAAPDRPAQHPRLRHGRHARAPRHARSHRSAQARRISRARSARSKSS